MDIMPGRAFIHTKLFDRKWKELGCDDDDLWELQRVIYENPQGPPVIRGTGGIRKIRFALDGKGKSGGARVLYIDFVAHETIGLLSVYSKNEQEDITEDERKALRDMGEQINKNWRDAKWKKE